MQLYAAKERLNHLNNQKELRLLTEWELDELTDLENDIDCFEEDH